MTIMTTTFIPCSAILGGIVAPIFAPLGWGTWQAAVAVLSGLIAKK